MFLSVGVGWCIFGVGPETTTVWYEGKVVLSSCARIFWRRLRAFSSGVRFHEKLTAWVDVSGFSTCMLEIESLVLCDPRSIPSSIRPALLGSLVGLNQSLACRRANRAARFALSYVCLLTISSHSWSRLASAASISALLKCTIPGRLLF